MFSVVLLVVKQKIPTKCIKRINEQTSQLKNYMTFRLQDHIPLAGFQER